MLQVNPSIVTEGLIYYIDLNNKKCYQWDGSVEIDNLITSSQKLSVAFIDGFVFDRQKRYIQNTTNNRFSGLIPQLALQDFTIQFFIKFNDAESPNSTFLSTDGLSVVSQVDEILFEGQNITFEGEPLTFTGFPDTDQPISSGVFELALNSEGKLGYKCANFNPDVFYSSLIFAGSAERGWNMCSFTRNFSKFRFYKNLTFEEYSFANETAYDNTFFLKGLTSYLNNFDIHHIFIYNRNLTEKEIAKNYRTFYSMYQNNIENLNFKPIQQQ